MLTILERLFSSDFWIIEVKSIKDIKLVRALLYITSGPVKFVASYEVLATCVRRVFELLINRGEAEEVFRWARVVWEQNLCNNPKKKKKT